MLSIGFQGSNKEKYEKLTFLDLTGKSLEICDSSGNLKINGYWSLQKMYRSCLNREGKIFHAQKYLSPSQMVFFLQGKNFFLKR